MRFTHVSEIVSLDAANIKGSIATLPNEQFPDFTLHEAKSFCKLLLKGKILKILYIFTGNPFVMETVFCPWKDDIHRFETNSWKKLLPYRKSLITKSTVEEFLTYIRCGRGNVV